MTLSSSHRLLALTLATLTFVGCAKEENTQTQFISAHKDDITFTWAWGVATPGSDDSLTCWYRSKIDLDDFTQDQKSKVTQEEKG